jgi:hypothetical protein
MTSPSKKAAKAAPGATPAGCRRGRLVDDGTEKTLLDELLQPLLGR